MSENKYMVDFEYKHTGTEDFIKGTTMVETDDPIDEDNYEHFNEIAKTLFRQIDGCTELRLINIVEDEPWLSDLHEILKGDNVDPK